MQDEVDEAVADRGALGKRIAIGCLSAAIFVVLAFGALLVYVGRKIDGAHESAEALCAHYTPGSSIEGFDDRARELGLILSPSETRASPDSISLHAAHGGFLLSQTSCYVRVRQGVVVGADLHRDD